MAITLGSIVLPDGLRWSDEHAWSPVSQATEWSLTGALIIEEAEKQAGRPITLTGGLTWVWMTKGDLETLLGAMAEATSAGLTLTLHDDREFQVLPVHGTAGPVSAAPVPRVRDSGLSDPDADALYYIDEIRLMVI